MKSLLIAIYSKFKKLGRFFLPSSVKQQLPAPKVGQIDFGDLRRLIPIDPNFGFPRGGVIDRYYIEKFLSGYSHEIKGRVLEIGDNCYTKKFGGSKVVDSDVLHYVTGNSQATIVGDLSKADHIPSNTFDCIILTQTLQMIYDTQSAIKHLYRILKPNGVLLVTSHGTSMVGRTLGVDDWGTYWRFTGQSMRIMFEDSFRAGNVHVATYGNVLTAAAFLYGLVTEDLTSTELDFHDKRYEVIVGMKACKAL